MHSLTSPYYYTIVRKRSTKKPFGFFPTSLRAISSRCKLWSTTTLFRLSYITCPRAISRWVQLSEFIVQYRKWIQKKFLSSDPERSCVGDLKLNDQWLATTSRCCRPDGRHSAFLQHARCKGCPSCPSCPRRYLQYSEGENVCWTHAPQKICCKIGWVFVRPLDCSCHTVGFENEVESVVRRPQSELLPLRWILLYMYRFNNFVYLMWATRW